MLSLNSCDGFQFNKTKALDVEIVSSTGVADPPRNHQESQKEENEKAQLELEFNERSQRGAKNPASRSGVIRPMKIGKKEEPTFAREDDLVLAEDDFTEDTAELPSWKEDSQQGGTRKRTGKAKERRCRENSERSNLHCRSDKKCTDENLLLIKYTPPENGINKGKPRDGEVIMQIQHEQMRIPITFEYINK
ncbi:hypothetical protein CAEBREN_11058 [Caenorhabditis brenneri]|uniref:Uncharacterized protein n=1 Tax=Caenorhabditis brenneri TaxID=135651 RepID=G0P6M0_CAEBE|nr:hypothetical protein CAEBREN_11058 [Caenorhabditis brenneri]